MAAEHSSDHRKALLQTFLRSVTLSCLSRSLVLVETTYRARIVQRGAGIGETLMNERERPEPAHDEPLEEECDRYGHVFEGYDTVSEICGVCRLIRDYPPSGNRKSRDGGPSEPIHVCRSAADHAFDIHTVCIYCGKPEATLTSTERAVYDSVKRARRGE